MILFVVLTLAAVVAAGPLNQPHDVQILRFENEVDTNRFNYAYEQTDGTRQEAFGEIVNEGKENQELKVKGSYGWVSPDGIPFTITYTADTAGYNPHVEQGKAKSY